MAQITYTANSLIENAQTIADLQNSKFIDYTDKYNLLNESYRDIYSRLTESDGDYFTKEIVFTTLTLAENSNGNSYKVDLPEDFYKVKFVDYNYGGNWNACQKFNQSQRNNIATTPMYRLINNQLWILGGGMQITSIKLTYYTPPEEIKVQKDDLNYSENAVATLPSYIGKKNAVMAYLEAGRYIKTESNTTGIITQIYDSIVANIITELTIYKDYIYFITSNNIMRRIRVDGLDNGVATTLFAAEDIATDSTCKYMSICPTNNLIYFNFKHGFTNAKTEYSINLDGSSLTSVETMELFGYGKFVVNDIVQTYVINNAHTLSVIPSGLPYFYVEDVLYATMKDNKIYYVDFENTMWVAEFFTSLTDYTITKLSDNISYLNNVNDDYASVMIDSQVMAISVIPDHIFNFPTNDVNEIMAYSMANGMVRKNSDDKKMALISARLNELWERFWSVNKRDEYQFSRINNDYANTRRILW